MCGELIYGVGWWQGFLLVFMIRGDLMGGKHAIGCLIGLTPGLMQIAVIVVRLRTARFTLYRLPQSAYDFQQCALVIINPSHYFILRLYN